ncbi:NYN domain-containing protein [Mycoplasmopsis gallinacea]|nr:NYN domain-containing protein [Mycoplasmopsis gallinacea]
MAINKKRIALFIDFDNFNEKENIQKLIEELKIEYDLLYSAAYFSKQPNEKQIDMFINLNIHPVLVITKITGKNSTDINLTVDVMKLVNNNHFDGFCIASSDNDFSYLAQTLKGYGKHIIGSGDDRLKHSYINIFDNFVNVSKLSKPIQPKETSEEFKKLIVLVNKLIEQRKIKDGFADFSQVIQNLKVEMRDFSPKNYGAQNGRAQLFFESDDLKKYFELIQDKGVYYIRTINEIKEETHNLIQKPSSPKDSLLESTLKVLSNLGELHKNEESISFSSFYGELAKQFPEYKANKLKQKFAQHGKSVQKIFVNLFSDTLNFITGPSFLSVGFKKQENKQPDNNNKQEWLKIILKIFEQSPKDSNEYVLLSHIGTELARQKINLAKFGLSIKFNAKNLAKESLNKFFEIKKNWQYSICKSQKLVSILQNKETFISLFCFKTRTLWFAF